MTRASSAGRKFLESINNRTFVECARANKRNDLCVISLSLFPSFLFIHNFLLLYFLMYNFPISSETGLRGKGAAVKLSVMRTP